MWWDTYRMPTGAASGGPATLASDDGNGVDEILKWRAVMDVGAGQEKSQRDALPDRRQVAFCARPVAIRWVGAGGRAPF